MILGFGDLWADGVERGEIQHSIRALGEFQWHIGASCDCYANPRRKNMRLLGNWPCVKVEKIQIWAMPNAHNQRYPLMVRINDQALSKDEMEDFWFRDGFRSIQYRSHSHEAYVHWKKRLPFTGQVIHWRYSR